MKSASEHYDSLIAGTCKEEIPGDATGWMRQRQGSGNGARDTALISQVFNLFLVDAKIVRDFMYQCDANLLAQFGGILEITNQGIGEDRDLVGQDGRIDRRAFG